MRSIFSKVRKLFFIILIGGWHSFIPTLKSYLPFCGRINNYRFYQEQLKNKIGLEIGGPSKVFKASGILPIYPIIASLDGCNFSTSTIWEGEIAAGQNYCYDRKKPYGYQYVNDAVDLRGVPSGKYDFVLSSHCLEHIANPIKALLEWQRVLKENGLLLLILPEKSKTFDRKRSLTTLKHLVQDYQNSIAEDDLTHLAEIVALHDQLLDIQKIDAQKCLNNMQVRSMHHHVFDKPLLIQLFDYLNIKILSIDFTEPGHIIVLGRGNK